MIVHRFYGKFKSSGEPKYFCNTNQYLVTHHWVYLLTIKLVTISKRGNYLSKGTFNQSLTQAVILDGISLNICMFHYWLEVGFRLKIGKISLWWQIQILNCKSFQGHILLNDRVKDKYGALYKCLRDPI